VSLSGMLLYLTYFILTCITWAVSGWMRLIYLMRIPLLMLYPVNVLRGKRGAAIGLCTCAVRPLVRYSVPCGNTATTLHTVRSAPHWRTYSGQWTIIYYYLLCAVTIYVGCMMRTPIPYSCTTQLLSRWRISTTGSNP